MRILLHSFIKLGVLISALMLVSACNIALLVDPTPSKPLSKIEERYSAVYEEKISDLEAIEFVTGQDVIVIADIEQAKVINLTNETILKQITSKENMIVNVQSSLTNKRFLLATQVGFAEIWDTRNWNLIRRFEGDIQRLENGLSPDGKMMYFNGTLWSVDNGKIIIKPGRDDRTDIHAFSLDSRYFVNGGFGVSFHLFDLKNNTEIPRKLTVERSTQISFRHDHHFYASYDAVLSLDLGGYYPNQLGLFDHTDNDLINSVTFNSRITCWNIMPDDKVLVALVSGDVILLDTQLSPIHKWNLRKYWSGKDKITDCVSGLDNRLWLGVKQAGIFKIDLASKTISNPIKTTHSSNSFSKLTLSQDRKYLAVSENNQRAENTVKVYQIKK